jgi:hypothetical protein
MFPTPTRILGHVPGGTPTSDPVNDPDLISEVQDHWWAEAYLPGSGWQELDPSFASAAMGQRFATLGANDQIPELPESVRHKVVLSLEIESYSEFPLGGPALQRAYPLQATFSTAALAGRPLLLSYGVDTDQQGGLVYANVAHTYSPFFQVGLDGPLTTGESFQEFLTNFPLASTMLTGVWLTIERKHPNGASDTYVRELKDAIGAAQRQTLGNITLEPRGFEAFLNNGDVAQVHVLPHSTTPELEVKRIQAELISRSTTMSGAYLDLDTVDLDDAAQTTEYLAEHLETILYWTART